MTPRILVAGIGNIFLGDDGFGVEVARRLAQRPQPEGVCVADFGIRGLDLAYALLEEREVVVFVDIATRGEPPGTLYLIEPEVDPDCFGIEAHGMDPVKVLALARSMGAPPTRTYLVACEPERVVDADSGDEMAMELSAPVRNAVPEAARMVESLIMAARGSAGSAVNLAAGGLS